MAKVICTDPGASSLINVTGEGVRFVEHEFGKISEEISEEMAALFCENTLHFRRHVESEKSAETSKKTGTDPAPDPKVKAPNF